ncbi:hypothetical protein LCGC14_0767060 [marine sediment metagenome]|uniref:Yeast cell wall synthesis Kre9/Knh1-like N-terminal domain-containing protein n=1 Tax=marine sediment metagenome TaxID=412755 RepID=A0A0F9QJ93_9ZZZZ
MWSSTGDIEDVNIALYNTTDLIEAIDTRVFNDGMYVWAIPSYLEEGNNYKIRISDYNNATIYDDSDYFEIYIPIASKTIHITSPDALYSWEVGTTQTIMWTSTGNVGNVRIQIYKDGEFLQIVSFSTSNTGSFPWFIPYSLESKDSYQIKIFDYSDLSISAYSEYFEIFDNSNNSTENIISGYNFFLLSGIISVTALILLKKFFKNNK